MTTKDVYTKATALESKLHGKLFLGGAKPSAEDVKAFNDLLGNGNLNLYRWAKHMATHSEGERKLWGAPSKVTVAASKPAAAPAASKPKAEAHAAAAAAPAHAEAKKAKPAAADADEDIDLFGETTAEEAAALEAKKAADAAKKKTKVAPVAKSSILFDIKAWEDTVNLEALAMKLHDIERDGLVWGDYKLVPVAYGVKKLQQLVVIEDDKISGDDLEDIIMGFEDEVQSMDIVAWNKV